MKKLMICGPIEKTFAQKPRVRNQLLTKPHLLMCATGGIFQTVEAITTAFAQAKPMLIHLILSCAVDVFVK